LDDKVPARASGTGWQVGNEEGPVQAGGNCSREGGGLGSP
jgi:hypothetical protein